ncbi:hypothetical protein [Olsenella uli]|mgnify:CR=1 FL=1|nr:hypothetical protein [Olsenella uli]
MAGAMPGLEMPSGRSIRVYHDLDVRLVLEDMFCWLERRSIGRQSV